MDIFFIAQAISLIIMYVLARWVINTLNNMLNSIRLLQQKMAEKAGVSKEDIDFAIGKK